jgi:hypothetical protein
VATRIQSGGAVLNTSGNPSVTPGSSITDGNVVYLALQVALDTAGSFPTSYTPPSGFTQIARVPETESEYAELVVFSKVASSEPGSYSVSWSGGAGTVGSALAFAEYSGLSTSSPNGTPVTGVDTSYNTTVDIPALTTGVDGSTELVIVGPGADSVSGSGNLRSAWGSSLVEFVDVAGTEWNSIALADAVRATAGTQAATSVTQVSADYGLVVRLELLDESGGGGGGGIVIARPFNQRFTFLKNH